MNKYSSAPKDIADAIRDAIQVSDKEALGDDWKKLPPGSSSTSKRTKGPSYASVSRGTKRSQPAISISKKTFRHVKVGDFRVEIPASADEKYTSALIHLLQSFIKSHPVKA